LEFATAALQLLLFGGSITFLGAAMLNSYQAELNGSQLIWIDQPPRLVEHRRVLVVMEDVVPVSAEVVTPADAYTAFIRAQGCLGQATRAQIDAQLVEMRSEWDDRPLSA
jgi:hypothetical protein